MELKTIEDIRIGQVYRSRDESFYNYSIIIKINKKTIKIINIQENKREYLISKSEFLFFNKLIGFLNITHKIEDNKLIEIVREEFEVGDIVMFNDNEKPLAIIDTYTEKSYKTGELEIVKFYRLFNGRDYADVERKRIIKKIGTYDVNFEFKNRKLIKG